MTKKEAGRKLTAGAERTKKVLVSFSPAELDKLRQIMKKQKKEYSPLASYIREVVISEQEKTEEK